MSKRIRIRNVPDSLRRDLKARAAAEGVSVSKFVVRELERMCSYPSQAAIVARIRARGEIKVSTPPEVVIRRERAARCRSLSRFF